MKETFEGEFNALRSTLSHETVDDLTEVLSDIIESSKKSVQAVEAMIHSVMTSIYLKKLNDIAINIGYFTLKRDKTKFLFMKKWYDWKLAKENKLLNKVEEGLNELKELEVKL